MSTMNTSSFHSDLLPGLVQKWFSTCCKDLPDYIPKMFKVEKSDTAYEVHANLTPMGSLVLKGQNSALQYDSSKEFIKPRYTHLAYALGFAITKEAIRDGHAFKDAKKFTEMLKRGAMVTRQIVGSNTYNYAGTSGYTMDGGDGVIFASASHPSYAGNQSNILSGGADLSEASIEALNVQIMNAKDPRGLRLSLQMDKLIVSPSQRADGHRILQTEKRVNTANNDTNFIRDEGLIKEMVVNPYLTSTTQWQVTTTCNDGAKFMVRQEAEMDTDNDFNTKNGLYSVDMRVSAGWDDWRGVYFSL